ncbi:MAG: CRTAC1 family protein [Planctomycetes bacterium]|nr:CRTAC1 family protein [Planctomycetota bacterium]
MNATRGWGWALVLGLASVGGCGRDDGGAPTSPTAPSVRPEPGPRFEEASEAAGIRFRMSFLPGEQGERFKINLYDHGAGLAVADVDGDGHDDVYFCNQLGGNALYRNRGDGTFEDVTARSPALALADRVSVTAAFADVDDDGDQDLYVTTTMGGNVLFRNEGALRFTDVTAAAGLTLVAHSQHATFFDADLDGHVDLLVSNTASWTVGDGAVGETHRPGVGTLAQLIACPVEHNRFYRNRGDGTFEDATAGSGLAGPGWGGDTAVLDLDADGDLDVVVANMFGASQVLRNDGKGRFEDVRRALLGRVSWGTVGVRAFDADGDGRLDLLFADMHSDMWMGFGWTPGPDDERRKYDAPTGPHRPDDVSATGRELYASLDVRPDDVVFGNTLFLARDGGRFDEASERAGVETLWPWGVAEADFDLDGDVDLFVPSGMGWPFTYHRSPLLVNRGDGTFVERSRDARLAPPGGGWAPTRIAGKPVARSLRAAATLDADGDGRPDLLVQPFNDAATYFHNVSPPRAWVGLRLVGTKGHRDAVGAVARLWSGDRVQVRLVQAAGGYLSQSSRTLLFGLGDARGIDRCEVTWPGGHRQRVDALRAGAVHAVEEAR